MLASLNPPAVTLAPPDGGGDIVGLLDDDVGATIFSFASSSTCSCHDDDLSIVTIGRFNFLSHYSRCSRVQYTRMHLLTCSLMRMGFFLYLKLVQKQLTAITDMRERHASDVQRHESESHL